MTIGWIKSFGLVEGFRLNEYQSCFHVPSLSLAVNEQNVKYSSLIIKYGIISIKQRPAGYAAVNISS